MGRVGSENGCEFLLRILAESPRAEQRELAVFVCLREIRVYYYTTDWLGFQARDWTRRTAPRFMHSVCC